MSKLRGYLALTLVCLTLLLMDPVQRLIIAPLARLFPSSRIRVLAFWQHFLAKVVLGSISVIGGARIPELPTFPGGPGTLILMNHQSLLDIPLVVAATADAYPRIVTRKRYLRWIPLISHMVRLYQYPVVDPAANPGALRKMLRSIRDAARTSDVPLVIFPEGTRTRDGEIRRFKTTGLKNVLRERSWKVYVMVADGFWQRARFKDFLGGMGDIEGRIDLVGPFAWEDPRADSEPFIRDMEKRMNDRLAAIRAPLPA